MIYRQMVVIRVLQFPPYHADDQALLLSTALFNQFMLHPFLVKPMQ